MNDKIKEYGVELVINNDEELWDIIKSSHEPPSQIEYPLRSIYNPRFTLQAKLEALPQVKLLHGVNLGNELLQIYHIARAVVSRWCTSS